MNDALPVPMAARDPAGAGFAADRGACHDTPLALVRRLIDGIDDAAVALLAGRRRLVGLAARRKSASGQPLRDPAREDAVRLRGRRLGARLGVPASSSDRLLDALIADACSLQGFADESADAALAAGHGKANHAPRFTSAAIEPASPWLRLFPPPTRWRALLRHLPVPLRAQAFVTLARRALRDPLAAGRFDPIQGRRIGIQVQDLDLTWIVSVRERALHVCTDGSPAETIVRGDAVDLLLLASRREDADTLFFQRRLLLTGDVELGLTTRNLLDQLPWADVPLAVRITLHRIAGLAQAARHASRAGRGTTP